MKDQTGRIFGRLTVTGFSHLTDKKEYFWNCECECGNKVTVRYTNLLGTTKSCGCLQREIASKNKKTNEYLILDRYVFGFTEKEEVFILDLEDFDKIKDYCWNITYDGYVTTCRNDKRIRMHRIIMKTKDEEIVDHINHNKYDNRKTNLRNCLHSNNSMNRKVSVRNKTGKTGVNIEKGKYRAFIYVNYKRIRLGTYDTFEEAKTARENAELKYFGEYAYREQKK